MYSDQLQAVILAGGRGSRMHQLTGSSVVKCLVPLYGHQLIYYTLKLLTLNGFKGKGGVLIIVQDEEREEVKKVVDKIGPDLGITPDLFSVPSDSQDFGPCESLRLAFAAKKIVRDVLVLSCDSITNVSLRNFINFHQIHGSACSALFLKHLPVPVARLPGPKSKTKQGRDIFGINPETSQLLFLASEADFDDEITFPLSTLRQCLNVKLHTSFIDSHIYIIRKNVLEQHLPNKNHISIKGEFLPFLISTQFTDGGSTVEPEKMLYAYLDTTKECIRVNTTPAYAIINKSADWLRKSFELEPPGRDSKPTGTAKLQSSIVGQNCEFGDKAKLVNTVVMDNVEVGPGSVLENCIVSSGAKIGANCVLKECLVGPKYVVAAEGKFNNEFLTVVDDTFFEP